MPKGSDRRTFLALAALVSAVPSAASAASPTFQPGDLYVFLYRKGPAWKEGVPMERQALRGHVDYMQGLMDDGRLFAGGRFMTVDGGMAIVVAGSAEEAAALLAADPAVTTGVFLADIQQWRPRFRSPNPLPAA